MRFWDSLPSAARPARAHVEVRLRRAFDLIARHSEAAQRLEQRPDIRRLPLVRFP
jgi:hypothetical protein